ncbi:MAG: DUF427 domain-containing protein [Nocardioidaceae bacterium]
MTGIRPGRPRCPCGPWGRGIEGAGGGGLRAVSGRRQQGSRVTKSRRWPCTGRSGTASRSRRATPRRHRVLPADSVRWEYLTDSKTHMICPWKGRAGYYHVVVDGEACPDGAFVYRHPSPLARKIRGHIAFWGGVTVEHGDDRTGDLAV